MAGKLKALQEWCRRQCDGYRDVKITNFTSSFKSGLAFCAIIHRYRPDLIDYDKLPKEDVFGNNKLAFDVAYQKLGIPALLDPEDMVTMTVPDKLCIVTYVAQYYNYFHNKPQDGGPGVRVGTKRQSIHEQLPPSSSHDVNPPDAKKSAQHIVIEDEPMPSATRTNDTANRRGGTLEDRCQICHGKVYLLERHIAPNGRLYHRHCYRGHQRASSVYKKVPDEKENVTPGSPRVGSPAIGSRLKSNNDVVAAGKSDSRQPYGTAAPTKNNTAGSHSPLATRQLGEPTREAGKTAVKVSTSSELRNVSQPMVTTSSSSVPSYRTNAVVTSSVGTTAASSKYSGLFSNASGVDRPSSNGSITPTTKIVSSASEGVGITKYPFGTVATVKSAVSSAPSLVTSKPSESGLKFSSVTITPAVTSTPATSAPASRFSGFGLAFGSDKTNKAVKADITVTTVGSSSASTGFGKWSPAAFVPQSTVSSTTLKIASASCASSTVITTAASKYSGLFSNASSADMPKYSSVVTTTSNSSTAKYSTPSTASQSTVTCRAAPTSVTWTTPWSTSSRPFSSPDDPKTRSESPMSTGSAGSKTASVELKTGKSLLSETSSTADRKSSSDKDKEIVTGLLQRLAEVRAQKASSPSDRLSKTPVSYATDRSGIDVTPKSIFDRPRTELTIKPVDDATGYDKRSTPSWTAAVVSTSESKTVTAAVTSKPEWQLEAERRRAARGGVYVDPEKQPRSTSSSSTAGTLQPAQTTLTITSVNVFSETRTIQIGKPDYSSRLSTAGTLSQTTPPVAKQGGSDVVAVSGRHQIVVTPHQPMSKITDSSDPALPVDVILSNLVELDSQLQVLESEGRELEEKIRSDTDDAMDAMEKDNLMGKWFDLIVKKNELVREESYLMYKRRQQELEQLHEELEYQLRCLLDTPDEMKSPADKRHEEELLSELVETVNLKSAIVDSIEVDRKRYLEEDEKLQAMMAESVLSGKQDGDKRQKKSSKIKKKSQTFAEKSPSGKSDEKAKTKKKLFKFKSMKKPKKNIETETETENRNSTWFQAEIE